MQAGVPMSHLNSFPGQHVRIPFTQEPLSLHTAPDELDEELLEEELLEEELEEDVLPPELEDELDEDELEEELDEEVMPPELEDELESCGHKTF